MNLEDFIKENKDEFDNRKLPDNDRETFRNLLKEELHQEKKVFKLHSNVWRIAAAIVISLGVYMLGRVLVDQELSVEMVETENGIEKNNTKNTLALLEEESSYKRIERINEIEQIAKPDEKTLKVLIQCLLKDDSPNVRFAALRGLENHLEDAKIRNTLIEALLIEKDSRIQVSIIHILIDLNEKKAIEPIQAVLENETLEPKVKAHISAILPQLI